MERKACSNAKARGNASIFRVFLTYSYIFVRASVSLVCSDCVERMHLRTCCAFAYRLSAGCEVGSIIASHVMTDSSTI